MNTLRPILFPALLVPLWGTAQECVDADGNTYATVQIGEQLWMAENLKTTRYNNGEAIPPFDFGQWGTTQSGMFSLIASIDSASADTFGYLYNWFGANDLRGICPTGWHLPSDDEWKTLEALLGMPASELDGTGYRGIAQNVGGQLKATFPWAWYGTDATNSSGFTALPAGYRLVNGLALVPGHTGVFWTSSSAVQDSAWYRALNQTFPGINRVYVDLNTGASCRCISDASINIDESDGHAPSFMVYFDSSGDLCWIGSNSRPIGHVTAIAPSGKVVGDHSFNASETLIAIDLHGCSTGIYLVHVQFRDGSVATQRIVKE